MVSAEVKEQIKQTMLDELTYHGWKKGDNEKIMELLPKLWKRLCMDGLMTDFIRAGFNYAHFVKIAKTQKLYGDIGIKIGW